MNDLINIILDMSEEVWGYLGNGRSESVYHNALALELRQGKVRYEYEYTRQILYKGHVVGVISLDFLIDGKLIVELKARNKIDPSHVAQTQAYQNTLFLPALIINFPINPGKTEIEHQVLDWSDDVGE